jgi:Na+/H+-translocating membrane pyrophosphatase
MATLLRLYLGWRLLRLLRPVLATAVILGAVLALHAGQAPVNGSAASAIRHGTVAARRDLLWALERAFQPGPGRP